jgi:two-component system, OmpR family, KDP operon response regulator KdpE
MNRATRHEDDVILIADDQHRHPRIYAIYFQSRGFGVVTAHDGAAAIQVALDHEPDVIVMDLAMPQSTATRSPSGSRAMHACRGRA